MVAQLDPEQRLRLLHVGIAVGALGAILGALQDVREHGLVHLVHQDAHWRLDDVVVVSHGKPLGGHMAGKLAKRVVCRLLCHLVRHSHVASGGFDHLRALLLLKVGQGQDLHERMVRWNRLPQVPSVAIVDRNGQGDHVIRQVLEDILAGAVADVGWELKAAVQERVGVVADQLGFGVVGHVGTTRSSPGSGAHLVISTHSLHGLHREEHIKGMVISGFLQLIKQVLRPGVLQVVNGVSVDVLHQWQRHDVLVQIPLVTYVLAAPDSHLVVDRLMRLVLKLVEPARLHWHRIHLHHEEGIIHVFEHPVEHLLHDDLEHVVGTRHPVLVCGIAHGIINVHFRVQVGRHVLDVLEALHPRRHHHHLHGHVHHRLVHHVHSHRHHRHVGRVGHVHLHHPLHVVHHVLHIVLHVIHHHGVVLHHVKHHLHVHHHLHRRRAHAQILAVDQNQVDVALQGVRTARRIHVPKHQGVIQEHDLLFGREDTDHCQRLMTAPVTSGLDLNRCKS
mmetsp:Transcript_37413/g.86403  ORF Transcript_37413/g.86403 Transcript_37413/m.86403 type:complete len:504 (-) Transcript_37413:93-1604(-)